MKKIMNNRIKDAYYIDLNYTYFLIKLAYKI